MTTQVTGSYEDICRWDNLYAAYRKAAKGKRSKAPATACAARPKASAAGSWPSPAR